MLIALFVFLNAYSEAAEVGNNTNEIVKVINYFNKYNSVSKTICYGPKKPEGQLSQEQLRKNQICAILNGYATIPPSRKISFDKSDPQNICAAFWKDGKSPFLTNQENAVEFTKSGEVTTVGVEYKAPTRKDVLSMGYTVGTKEQLEGLINDTKAEIEGVAAVCCEKDEICKSAMRQVNVRICTDPKADVDPDQPDGCYGNRTGYFQQYTDENEYENYAILIARGLKNFNWTDFKQAFGVFPKDLLDAYPSDKGIEPTPGGVVLSPYFVNGLPYSRRNLIHELSHACSSIRRQSLILQSDKESSNLAESVLKLYFSEDCTLNKSIEVAYQKILSPLDFDNRLCSCIVDMASKSSKESSLVYSPNACAKEKLEESTAEAIAMAVQVEKGAIVPDLYPTRLCLASPSNVHPHLSELAKCLFLKNPKIMKTAQAKLGCERVTNNGQK